MVAELTVDAEARIVELLVQQFVALQTILFLASELVTSLYDSLRLCGEDVCAFLAVSYSRPLKSCATLYVPPEFIDSMLCRQLWDFNQAATLQNDKPQSR